MPPKKKEKWKGEMLFFVFYYHFSIILIICATSSSNPKESMKESMTELIILGWSRHAYSVLGFCLRAYLCQAELPSLTHAERDSRI